MATAKDVKRIALALEGTSEAPHFDRTAFKVARIYATLAADGKTLNLKLNPGEQEMKCMTAPAAFQRIPNAWGDQGWTTVLLNAIGVKELQSAMEAAWSNAQPRKKGRKKS